MLRAGALAAVHVFFPDPWPKARHHKRRLIQPATCRCCGPRLRPGGVLHCATDWEPYAEQMLATLDAPTRAWSTCTTATRRAPRTARRPGSNAVRCAPAGRSSTCSSAATEGGRSVTHRLEWVYENRR